MTNKDYYNYSSKRTECPLCGSKDGRADIIFDKRTNIAYNENVGYFKCHSCGETRSPNIDPKFKDSDSWIKTEKPKINTNPKPMPKQKTANEIKSILNSNYADSMANQSSNFHNWINNLSRDSTAFDTFEIGTDKIGATNFWYRDIDGNITYAKTMAYSENGERLKEDANPLKNADGTSKIALNGYVKGRGAKYPIYEYHISDLGYNTNGIFNYNRLCQGDYESIFVLESEKNCVLASILMPEYCFVTGGGSTAFTLEKSLIVEKFATQFNKQVFALYDLDKSGFDNTIAICNREFLVTDYTTVFDEYIKSRKGIELKSGFDVADFCKLVLERKIKKVHLIKELNKIYLSYFEEEKPKKEQIAKSLIIRAKMIEYLDENYQFRYNIVKTRYEYNKKSINNEWTWVSDRVYNTIFNEIQERGNEVDFNKLIKYIESDASKDYDPFKEFLEQQPQYNAIDEPDYIQQIADLIEVDASEKHIRDNYFQRWFVGIYQQAMLKTCSQFILIFIGEGGIGKDQFANSLLPKCLKEYIAGFDFMNIDKDSKLAMCNNIILNCAELEYMNKTDQAKVKSTIGENYFVLRASYGRVQQRYERRGSFIGSANLESILADETGSRRYLVIRATNIQWQNISENLITRAYKQAEFLSDAGFNIHLNKEEIAKVNEYNEQYRNTSLPEELIKMHFKMVSDHADGMTSGELLLKLMNYSNQMKEYHNTRLGAILKKLGYTAKVVRTDDGTPRRYNIEEKVNINKFSASYSNN